MKQVNWQEIDGFEWDEGNREKSWKKHKASIKETEEVFANKPLKFVPDEKHSAGEIRYVAYGKTNMYRKLAVVFTIRKNVIRIISARNISKKERKAYEKN